MLGGLRRLLEPLTDLPVALALLLFWVCGAVAITFYLLFSRVSPGFGVLALAFCLWLFAPAFVRYLLALLEARALRHATPQLSVGHFNPVEGSWRLTPLLYAVLLYAGHAALARLWPAASILLPAAFACLVLPLALTQLAVTHSMLESLNPAGWWRLLKRLGTSYAPIPLLLAVGAVLLSRAGTAAVHPVWLLAGWLYLVMLAALSIGHIASARVGRDDIHLPEPVMPSAASLGAAAERERCNVLNHAYGFVSRDNRAGGFAHLAAYAARCDEPLAAEYWFLQRMLCWENREPALAYARDHLQHLLDAGYAIDAMKLIARCLHENPRFGPHAADRERLLAAARALGNADIERALQG